MVPIQSRIRDMALAKSSTVAPVASTDPAQVTFTWSGSSFECSPLSNPSAPPPTPTNSLLDIHPRKSSFSSEYGLDAACAFPSWPQRPSLSTGQSQDSYCSAYLSDEDLLWMPENAGTEPPELTEETPKAKTKGSSMTTEQQLARMRAAAEEEDRRRFLAKVEAHARATQALRHSKQLAAGTTTTTTASTTATSDQDHTPKRRKRRVVPTPKRRAHSSSAKMTSVAH